MCISALTQKTTGHNTTKLGSWIAHAKSLSSIVFDGDSDSFADLGSFSQDSKPLADGA